MKYFLILRLGFRGHLHHGRPICLKESLNSFYMDGLHYGNKKCHKNQESKLKLSAHGRGNSN